MKIAILGAESTGKTELAQALVTHFSKTPATQAKPQVSKNVHLVPEYLREWCNTQGRTPRADEQLGIATVHAHRLSEAALKLSKTSSDNVLIADTTPLMVAVYSDLLFSDTSLYAMALAHQATYDLTLLTGLDLPWVADGFQRDGPQVREPVDAFIRAALTRGKINYQVVYGAGNMRLNKALRCVQALSQTPAHRQTNSDNSPPAAHSTWAWTCERCSDSDCEHRLFTSLLPNNKSD